MRRRRSSRSSSGTSTRKGRTSRSVMASSFRTRFSSCGSTCPPDAWCHHQQSGANFRELRYRRSAQKASSRTFVHKGKNKGRGCYAPALLAARPYRKLHHQCPRTCPKAPLGLDYVPGHGVTQANPPVHSAEASTQTGYSELLHASQLLTHSPTHTQVVPLPLALAKQYPASPAQEVPGVQEVGSGRCRCWSSSRSRTGYRACTSCRWA